MKIVKVTIVKTISNNDESCRNSYPKGYDAKKVQVICYEDKDWSDGDHSAYCIGIVEDGFVFTKDMVEITRVKAETYINAAADHLAIWATSVGKRGDEMEARYKGIRAIILDENNF